MKKKLLLVIPALSGGGAENVVRILLRHLDRTIFQLNVALLANVEKGSIEAPADILLHDFGCTKTRQATVKLIRLMWDIKPDVVMSTIGHVNILMMLIRPFLPRRIRFLARETNIPSINIQQTPCPAVLSFLYPRLYPKFDAIICQSNDMRRDLEDNFGIYPDRTQIINNPVDCKYIDSLKKKGSSPLPGGKNFVAAGKLKHQKGFDLLLKSFAQLEDMRSHLTILGKGPELGKLRDLAKTLGVEKRVTMKGFCQNPFPYMASADVFVLSSRYEGFPNVVLEANACGTPVVAFNCPGGIDEIIKDGENGWLVEPGNIRLFTKAMRRALHTPFDSDRIMQFVREKFGVERIVKKYESVLME